MTAPLTTTEAELATLLEDGLRRMRVEFYHTHDSRRSAEGFPDYVIRTVPLIVAELKAEGGEVTRAQIEWLGALDCEGVDARLVTGIEGVERLLREVDKRDRRPKGAAVTVQRWGNGPISISGAAPSPSRARAAAKSRPYIRRGRHG